MGKVIVNWKVLIVPVLLASYIFAFSMTTLWLGDDITYAYSFKDGTRITSLSQIVPSQLEHYKTVNGRFIVHYLCQLFIPLFGKSVFSFSNALANVVLLLLMAKLCQIKYDDLLNMSFLACFIVLGFRTKFTPTCQIGYSWMFVLIIAFLLILKRFDDRSLDKWKTSHLIWAAPLSFIAGWSQESIVVGVGVALFFYCVFNLKKISFSQWIVLVSFAVGAAMLCLSPATLGRTGESHGESSLMGATLYSLAKFAFYLRISYLMLALILYLRLFRGIKFKVLFSIGRFYWIIWFTMLVFNLIIGVFGNRQLFGMEFAAIVIIFSLIKELHSSGNFFVSSFSQKALLTALLITVTVVTMGNIKFLMHNWTVYNQIKTDYESSQDGIVYYNFSASDVTFKDTYPSDVFSWYAIESINRSYGSDKRLRIIPTLCANLDSIGNGNYWETIAPGAIAIVVEKHNLPKSVSIKRSIFRKQLSDLTVGLSNPIFENDSRKVYLIYQKLLFIAYSDVQFNF